MKKNEKASKPDSLHLMFWCCLSKHFVYFWFFEAWFVNDNTYLGKIKHKTKKQSAKIYESTILGIFFYLSFLRYFTHNWEWLNVKCNIFDIQLKTVCCSESFILKVKEKNPYSVCFSALWHTLTYSVFDRYVHCFFVFVFVCVVVFVFVFFFFF